jgi:hypothetical protein
MIECIDLLRTLPDTIYREKGQRRVLVSNISWDELELRDWVCCVRDLMTVM